MSIRRSFGSHGEFFVTCSYRAARYSAGNAICEPAMRRISLTQQQTAPGTVIARERDVTKEYLYKVFPIYPAAARTFARKWRISFVTYRPALIAATGIDVISASFGTAVINNAARSREHEALRLARATFARYLRYRRLKSPSRSPTITIEIKVSKSRGIQLRDR